MLLPIDIHRKAITFVTAVYFPRMKCNICCDVAPRTYTWPYGVIYQNVVIFESYIIQTDWRLEEKNTNGFVCVISVLYPARLSEAVTAPFIQNKAMCFAVVTVKRINTRLLFEYIGLYMCPGSGRFTTIGRTERRRNYIKVGNM
jgi:hypothetical protein